MKKLFSQKQRGIIVALLSLLCVISLKAQTWTAPTLTGSALSTGTTYYVYNVGSNGYLTAGANWGTQSAVSAQPRANASTSVVKYTATNTSGSIWTFQYNLNGSDVANWFLCPTVADGNGYVETNDWEWAIREPNRPWNVVQTDATNNIYSLQVPATYGGYNATQYLGSAAATESTNRGIANTVKYNRATGDSYTKWKFASQADLDLYNARVLLDKYMTYGKNKGMDVTVYVTTYNAGVTADITTAAATLLTELGRTDVTSSIINPSFEDATALFGWTNAGSFAKQTNVPGQGWTKNGSAYSEKWVTQASNLGTGSITQTISGISNGLYGLVVSAHAVKQYGANPLHTGAYITAGSQSTEVVAGQDYSIENIVVADGSLTVGYALSGTVACNWTGFDNFRLYYYGSLAIPNISLSKSQFLFNGDINYLSDSLTVTGLNLSGAISISAPAGIVVSPTTLPSGATSAKVFVSYDGSSSVSGNITFTSGSTTANVAVSAASSVGCFTPLYLSGNKIADPYLNSLSTFGGWGAKSINADPAFVYCGLNSGKITGAKAGSIDVDLTGKLRTDASYRIKAMIYSVGGQSQIGISNVGATIPETRTATVDAWETLNFTFNTGATLGASPLMYFNNYITTGGSTTSYIDNWEMYQIPSVLVAESTVGAMATNVGSTDSKTITVSGKGLSDAITLALSGTNANQFSLSSASLPLAADSVVSTVVTITYTPTIASLNHEATLTLSSAGVTDKVFALTGSAGSTSSIESVNSGWNAVVANQKLKVIGVDSYEVYTVQGLRVAQVRANASAQIVSLNQGVYIVRTDKGVQKVIVR